MVFSKQTANICYDFVRNEIVRNRGSQFNLFENRRLEGLSKEGVNFVSTQKFD